MGNFALRLRELREKSGLTQAEVGEKAGIHMLTVAKLEQGIREPGWATVQALADALGVECTAFKEPPGDMDTSPRPRGRPVKVEEKPVDKKRPKKKP